MSLKGALVGILDLQSMLRNALYINVFHYTYIDKPLRPSLEFSSTKKRMIDLRYVFDNLVKCVYRHPVFSYSDMICMGLAQRLSFASHTLLWEITTHPPITERYISMFFITLILNKPLRPSLEFSSTKKRMLDLRYAFDTSRQMRLESSCVLLFWYDLLRIRAKIIICIAHSTLGNYHPSITELHRWFG